MSAAASLSVRAIALDLTKRCNAGDFGGRNSLLRARIDAHAVKLWRVADDLEEAAVSTRRTRQGTSRLHRAKLALRRICGLRGGVQI